MSKMRRKEQIYMSTAKMLKAISDPKRLRIVDMLSCGELCASEIKDVFSTTQPTMSYHMKLLVDAGIVLMRNEGKYVFYSLNNEYMKKFFQDIQKIASPKENCICHSIPTGECRR